MSGCCASKVQPSRSAVERLHARAIKNGIIPLVVENEKTKGGRRRKERNERCGFFKRVRFVGHWRSCSIESFEHVETDFEEDGVCYVRSIDDSK